MLCHWVQHSKVYTGSASVLRFQTRTLGLAESAHHTALVLCLQVQVLDCYEHAHEIRMRSRRRERSLRAMDAATTLGRFTLRTLLVLQLHLPTCTCVRLLGPAPGVVSFAIAWCVLVMGRFTDAVIMYMLLTYTTYSPPCALALFMGALTTVTVAA